MTSSPPVPRPAVPLLGPLLLAALAGAGAASAVTMLLHEAPAANPAGAAANALPSDLLARLDDIERRLARAAPVVTAPANVAPDAAPSERTAGDVERRLAALQQQVADLVASRAVRDAAAGQQPADLQLLQLQYQQAEQRRREEGQKTIAAQQAVILDPRSDEKQKVAAWGQLRHLENSWNDAVVATMTHLGLSSTDPDLRADVWRQADGRSKHPAMASALLQALTADTHAKSREEAAETLGEYLTTAGVRQALELASTNDADPGVRRQALECLAPRR